MMFVTHGPRWLLRALFVASGLLLAIGAAILAAV